MLPPACSRATRAGARARGAPRATDFKNQRKSQFTNFQYNKKEYVFIRTEQQIDKIIKECNKLNNSIILYTIVETKLAKYVSDKSEEKNIPCFTSLDGAYASIVSVNRKNFEYNVSPLSKYIEDSNGSN